MPEFTQENRILTATTPLGDDVLLLSSFAGAEKMSRGFSYDLHFLSEDPAIGPDALIGHPIGWAVEIGDEPRHFHGIVSRFKAGGLDERGRRTYHAEVVPWLWLLTLDSDCRIFQEKTAPDIVKLLFSEFGFSDYEMSLQGTYDTRVYCVQYRESTYDFILRLLEEEGIFFFVRHEEGKHVVVFGDRKSHYGESASGPVRWGPGAGATYGYVTSWERAGGHRTGKWAHTDYNFETPSTSLATNVSTLITFKGISKLERYVYPGGHAVTGIGTDRIKVRMEAEEAEHDLAHGTGGWVTFTVGGKFTLEEHPIEAENQEYVITAVGHSATDRSYESGGRSDYSNTFSCIPSKTLFRAMRITEKPVIHGPQTAIVVGPSGEEIYTDKYGRIKAQFHWDRLGKNDENSSCWMRVAQSMAGGGWGAVFLPRIGQEVVVSFLEGDPDRPLVTGVVYNAEQMPPYALPDNQTRTVLKSRSTPNGDAETFNELYFEDKAGKELVYFHAQKDFKRVVEHNDDLKVGKDQTITIKNMRSAKIEESDELLEVSKGNRKITVLKGNDDHVVDKGNLGVKVATGNYDLLIDTGNRFTKIAKGNDTLKVSLGSAKTEAMQTIELKVGSNSLKIDQSGIQIKGIMVKIEGQAMTDIKAPMTKVGADAMLMMKGGITMIG